MCNGAYVNFNAAYEMAGIVHFVYLSKQRQCFCNGQIASADVHFVCGIHKTEPAAYLKHLPEFGL